MTDLYDASIRELVTELAAVEERLLELEAAVDCPEGRSWTAAELARLSRRERDILVSLREWRLSRVRRGVPTGRGRSPNRWRRSSFVGVTDYPEPSPRMGEPTGPDVDATCAHDDALADEMEKESFPGSDPPSTWAGHDHPRADGA